MTRIGGAALGDIQTTATTNQYAVQFATDSGTSTTYYLGEAAIGSTTATSTWRIMRIETASDVQITWADGDEEFDNVWDDRESLSYS